jgi:hypothetical protein
MAWTFRANLPAPNLDRRLPFPRVALGLTAATRRSGWWLLSLLADLAEGCCCGAPNPSALCRKRLSVVLGQVAESFAHLVVHGLSAPADLTRVGRQHAEDDPHGGGLAGTVGPDEPEHLALAHGERQVIEGDQVAVAAGQALQFQHVTPLLPLASCQASAAP